MDDAVLQIKGEITRQIEEHVRQTYVGVMATPELLVRAEHVIRQSYSKMLGIDEHRIQVRNLRFEGRTMTWDGIELML